MKKINRLYIVTDVNLNEKSAQPIHIFSVAKNFARIGLEVRLIYPLFEDEIPQLPHEVIPEPVKITRKISVGMRLYHLYLFKKLIQLPRPDALYVRLSGQIITPALWCGISNTPMFLEVNGIPEVEYLAQQRKKGIIVTLRTKKIKLTEYINFKKSKGIIFVTEQLKKYFVSKYRIPEEKVIVITNGSDIEIFRPIEKIKIRDELAIDHNIDLLIGFVGSLQPWHGVDDAIKAVKILRDQGIKCYFFIVGDGPEKENLESLTNSLGLEETIKFVGFVPWDIVPLYINSFDLCIAPLTRKRNSHSGVSPLKLYEYMACGKPIVATDVPGLEIVTKYKVGINAIADSPESLAKAIIELIARKAEWEEMGKRGREYVEKHASWQAVAEKTLQFIQEKLKSERI